MTVISLVKNIARQIKYLELEDTIGKNVIVNSTDTIYEDVKKHLPLIREITPVLRDEKYSRLGIAKYGLIDIDFTIEELEINNAVTGFEAIRMLNLYQENQNPDDDFFLEFGIGFLEDMVEELKSDKTFYMLFLQTEYSETNYKEEIRQYLK